MARETYELSDETRKVLTDHVKPVADEMDKTPQYLHAILSGVETDIFAKFVPLYAAAVRLQHRGDGAGADGAERHIDLPMVRHPPIGPARQT